MAVNGQLWYLTQGSGSETKLVRINDDGSQSTIVVSGAAALATSFPQEVVLDPASGFYFIIANGGPTGDNGYLLRGNINSSAAPTVVVDFPDTAIINTMQINPYTGHLYVGYQDGDGVNAALSGIKDYTYNPSTGALTDNGFIVTAAALPTEGGFSILDPYDFALNATTNTLYFTENLSALGVVGLYRTSLSSPGTIVQLVKQSQFPDDGSGGFIIDVEVDASNNKVYFTTESRYPSPDAEFDASQNAIWYVDGSATNGTAVKVTLGSFTGSGLFYPGDMTFDPVSRQLYVESEQNGNLDGDDVIYVFQLDAAGTSATFVKTINTGLSDSDGASGANIGGIFYDNLPDLAISANSSHAVEQTNYTLLGIDPTITDIDGDHLANASVKTSGSFAGSGDQLSVAGQTSGTVSGTNIVISITTDGSGNQTMTLTGYDTIAHYQQVLGDVRFVANSDNPTNYGSNTTRTVTWQVNDGITGSPTNGNVGQHTFTIDTVNDAPVMAGDLGATVLEGGSYTLTSSDINYTDQDDTSAGVTFTVSNLSHGTLTVNGVTQTSFSYSQLIGGLVVFTHDGSEGSSASFSISVEDGNEDNSAPSNSTFSLAVTAVNDAPVLTGDLAAAMGNGASYVLTTTDLNFTDVDDTASGVTFTVTNQTNGTVWVNGSAATSFTGQQLASGLVSFHHDGTNTLVGSFKVSVEDGNEDNSAPVQSTFNFTVAPANLPPTLTGDLSATVVEGDSYILSTSDIGYADSDDTSAGVTFTVSNLSHGTVLVNGSAATTFTYAQLQSGVVTFVHNGDEAGTASFSVSVEDGNEDGSAPTPSTFNFTVTAVNDAPVLTGDLAATISEGGTYQLTTADVGYADPDDIAANVTFSVTNITGVALTVNGVAATSFTGQQLIDGLVSFQHDGSETTTAHFKISVEDGNEDGSAPTQSTFNFTVSAVNDAPVLTGDLAATLDEGGSYQLTSSDLGYTDVDDVATGVTFTVSNLSSVTVLVNGVSATSFTGQQLTDGLVVILHNGSETTAASFDVSVDDGNEDSSTPVASTFNLTVTPVNDAPVVNGDLTGTVLEGGSYALTTSDLNFSDPDDTSSGVTFTVSNLSHGSLLVDGVSATSFTFAQLSGGLVIFTHDGGETTAASFDVSVEDGNEDGSTAVASTFNLTVTPVNDAPVLTGDLAAVIVEGGSYELTSSDLGFTDPDDIASGVTFTVSDLSGLTMTVNGVSANSFTGQQLIDGLVSVQHDGSEGGTASFEVSVDDGNEDSSTPSTSTFNFTVNATNDAPVLTGDLAAVVAEGGSYALTSSDLGFTDTDDTASGVIFTVSDLTGVTLQVDGVTATSFTGLQLANGLVSVLHDGSESSAASFKVSVEDGNEDGSTPSESTFNLTVTPVNDAPIVAGDLAATMLEGDTYQLTTTDLNFTDPDDTSLGMTFTISNLSHGSLQVSGVAAGSFTFDELQSGLVTFVHDGGEAANASFKVAVEDGNEDSSTPTPSTFNFTITPVNDAPVLGGDLTAAIDNGQNYKLRSSDLSYTDPDDDASDVTFTISNLANGKVLVNGVIASSFTGQQLTEGLVSFKHDGSQTTTGSFDVVVEDGNEDNSTPTPSTFNFSVSEVNDAPTAIAFSHVKDTLAENTDTSSRIKLADIGVIDDNLGTNELSLSGADAKYFRIIGDALYLRQGVDLDFEDKKTYKVTVEVNDPTIDGNQPELTKNFQLKLTDINEAPAMTLENQVRSLAESASTLSDRRVADIVISDDALGKDELSLSGADARYFKISGDGLYLKRGVDLDYEDKKTYSVSVALNDPSIDGDQPEVTRNFQLKVTDVNEAPSVMLGNRLVSISESPDHQVRVADIKITDDALGDNNLSLGGGDAWMFRIHGGGLYLKANAYLDGYTNPYLNVSVRVDDKSIGSSFEDSATMRIEVLMFQGEHHTRFTHASEISNDFGSVDLLL